MSYVSLKGLSGYKLFVATLMALASIVFFSQINAAFAQSYKIGDIEVADPWSRATPDSAKVAGGYLTIINNGKTKDRLVSVSSELSNKTEIHVMRVDGKVMEMRPVVDGVQIPAGKKVVLSPDKMHVMFMDISKPLKEGDEIKSKLVFEKAGSVDVVFHVTAMGARNHDAKPMQNEMHNH